MGDLKGQSKGQKLASAVYLVTSFFDDKEPLKWRLRSIAIDFVSDNIKDKFHLAKEALALFSLAKNSSLVSETNHDILAHELSKLERESEKPFDTSFFQETREEKRALEAPVQVEPIKDKI
ncbi:MAG: hypothetical protein AAB695_01215, partial [Patescibacteria group bacterium]